MDSQGKILGLHWDGRVSETPIRAPLEDNNNEIKGLWYEIEKLAAWFNKLLTLNHFKNLAVKPKIFSEKLVCWLAYKNELVKRAIQKS